MLQNMPLANMLIVLGECSIVSNVYSLVAMSENSALEVSDLREYITITIYVPTRPQATGYSCTRPSCTSLLLALTNSFLIPFSAWCPSDRCGFVDVVNTGSSRGRSEADSRASWKTRGCRTLSVDFVHNGNDNDTTYTKVQ